MHATPVQISVGKSKKWKSCTAALAPSGSSVTTPTITIHTQTVTKVSRDSHVISTVSTCLPLSRNNKKYKCDALYESVWRPYCLNITRPGMRRVQISFDDATDRARWLHLLTSQPPNQGDGVAMSETMLRVTEADQQLNPTDSSAGVYEESRTQEIFGKQKADVPNPVSEAEDDMFYEYMESCHPPSTKMRIPSISSTYSLESIIDSAVLPPPLPRRPEPLLPYHLSVYDSANYLLFRIHSLSRELEANMAANDITSADSTSNPVTALPSSEVLVDISEDAELHYDSIPIPDYPGPTVPQNTINRDMKLVVGEYLKPVRKSIADKISCPQQEPIYATIIKMSRGLSNVARKH